MMIFLLVITEILKIFKWKTEIMDFNAKKYLLETTIKVIKESNGNGMSKSFDPKNIAKVYYQLHTYSITPNSIVK